MSGATNRARVTQKDIDEVRRLYSVVPGSTTGLGRVLDVVEAGLNPEPSADLVGAPTIPELLDIIFANDSDTIEEDGPVAMNIAKAMQAEFSRRLAAKGGAVSLESLEMVIAETCQELGLNHRHKIAVAILASLPTVERVSREVVDEPTEAEIEELGEAVRQAIFAWINPDDDADGRHDIAPIQKALNDLARALQLPAPDSQGVEEAKLRAAIDAKNELGDALDGTVNGKDDPIFVAFCKLEQALARLRVGK